ncbi:MAG: DUF3179 domain-containing protein [Proteobacteria bacterium]|nr:DUF3179 domain-containing protein [Pseudomonadota bacterium]
MQRALPIGALVLALAATSLAADPARWRALGWKTDFSQTRVPLTEILSGGPPRDGIPPIDRPMFRPAREVTDLAERDPVLVYPLDANARAYPLRVLTWHEIVNDTVADLPVAVTYCPLCNAGIVFDRRVEGRVLDFGTTGLLRKSDLVMWDRQTESWWQQFSGEAIVGKYAGTTLRMLPSRLMAYGEFAGAWPSGLVLTPANPQLRAYGKNPYVGYDGRASPYELFSGELPRGVPAMARVVVARTPAGPVAVALALLAERGRLEHGGVIFTWRAGQASALDGADIATSRDVGSARVTAASGAALVYDVTFAFVLNAFVKDVTVLTKAGPVNLASGAPAAR